MRLVAYMPALQREQSVTATLDQHRAGATPPEYINELHFGGLGAALTPDRIAAAQVAYKALRWMVHVLERCEVTGRSPLFDELLPP